MAVAEKVPGAGAVICYDLHNRGNWLVAACILDFTPPPREHSPGDHKTHQSSSNTAGEGRAVFTSALLRQKLM